MIRAGRCAKLQSVGASSPRREKKKAAKSLWAPTDAKRARARPLSHITDPLLRNLLDDDARADPVRARAQLAMMRESPAYFASVVLRGPPQAPYNGRFMVADHHVAWDELVTTHKRLCVLAARDHGKTFFFDFAYVLWKICFQANGRGYIFSATQAQAIRILGDVKDEIEGNPRLSWLRDGGFVRWTSTSITLANGHKVYARGYGTKVRGAHPDWIVVDDGLNDEDAYSEIVRRKNIDYFFTAITNMIVPGGQIIVVGTPFHAADLYSELKKNPRYHFAKFSAVVTTDGVQHALWPERYALNDEDQAALEAKGVIVESLAKRALEIGPIRFAREFRCDPVSDDMSLFPERLFRGQDVEIPGAVLGAPRRVWASAGILSFYVGVDIALSSTTGADYFVIFVLGLDAQGNRWIVDLQREKGLSYQEQLSRITATGRRYAPDLIYIEANQMQRVWGDELIRTTDLPIAKFYTTGGGMSAKARRRNLPKGNTVSANKNSLEGGVPGLRVPLENRKLRVPRGDTHSVEMTDLFVEEMKAFTWSDNKLQGVGAHDDLVMGFWIAMRAALAGSSTNLNAFDKGGDLADLSDAELQAMQTVDPTEGIYDEDDEGADDEEDPEEEKPTTPEAFFARVIARAKEQPKTPPPTVATAAGKPKKAPSLRDLAVRMSGPKARHAPEDVDAFALGR